MPACEEHDVLFRWCFAAYQHIHTLQCLCHFALVRASDSQKTPEKHASDVGLLTSTFLSAKLRTCTKRASL